MRRMIALALTVVFSLQTTASAAEAPRTANTPALFEQISVAIRPVIAAIESSQAFALITGQEQRYALIHEPKPQFDRYNVPRPTTQQTNFSDSRGSVPVVRIGVARIFDLKALANTQRGTAPLNPVAPAPVARPAICPQTVGGEKVLISCQCQNGNCPTPTPRPTPTPVPTPTPTPVPTPTPTPVPTPTPTPVPTPTPTPVPTPTPTPKPTPTPTPVPTPTPIPVTPTPVPTATPGPPLTPTTTGINPWWTYESGKIPGVGQWMDNVGNGNLLVQATDVDIPERGIDLGLRRTYNSRAIMTNASSDGATPSLFGNGWTNTFDAHIAYNAAASTFSVYDVDGAR